ncbi:MAG: hypothetical protein LPK45_06315, partial [Bacteroidota bacterium]|nr:hypothetical protein [Bacteroidota bacterium]MDX5430686.1 hypothetical protein [Bacteroidota bacterium]MDX5469433.1 hypothetical protein [Bacteroidota bacterium]
FIGADTLRSVGDSLKRKSLFAFHGVKMYKTDMQGICDSMHYSQKDSMIYMERDPVLWNESRQMVADSIRIRTNGNKVDRADFIDEAIIIEEVDSGLYNQLRGNTVIAWFRNDKLNEIFVQGNAENVYFQEEGEEKDTATIASMNYVICSDIRIRFDTAGKADQIVYYEKPEGTDYPIDQLPGGEKQELKGFLWRDAERPKSKLELYR